MPLRCGLSRHGNGKPVRPESSVSKFLGRRKPCRSSARQTLAMFTLVDISTKAAASVREALPLCAHASPCRNQTLEVATFIRAFFLEEPGAVAGAPAPYRPP